ncbi:MAG: hypothetical protein WCR46_14855 [Deltaproteobacteria bacterium]
MCHLRTAPPIVVPQPWLANFIRKIPANFLQLLMQAAFQRAADHGILHNRTLSSATNLILMAALLTVAGFVVSAIFTRYAHQSGHPRSLYAADVAGGGIGTLVCGVLFFPLLGLSRSVFLLAGMSISVGIGAARLLIHHDFSRPSGPPDLSGSHCPWAWVLRNRSVL